MTAVSTLAYGLTVRAVYLVTASKAWPSLVKTFDFINLVLLRRRQGTLTDTLSATSRGGGGGLIAKVPTEVWEKIRKMVVDSELQEAEEDFLSSGWKCGEKGCPLSKGVKTWKSIEESREKCKNCCEFEGEDMNLYDSFRTGSRKVFGPIHTLLAAFGLAHPLAQIIPNPLVNWTSIGCLALIALPLRIPTQKSAGTTLTAKNGWNDLPDQHTLVDVYLDLPPNADVRFIRFVNLFNLPVVNASLGTLGPVNPQEPAQIRINSPQKSRWKVVDDVVGIKFEDTKEIKPKWKLYGSCYQSWATGER